MAVRQIDIDSIGGGPAALADGRHIISYIEKLAENGDTGRPHEDIVQYGVTLAYMTTRNRTAPSFG